MGIGDEQQSHALNLSARCRAPARRWVLADTPIDGLTKQVGVAGVSAVLLDQVAQQAAQARVLSRGGSHGVSVIPTPYASRRYGVGWGLAHM
jgi:hypothetical protein